MKKNYHNEDAPCKDCVGKSIGCHGKCASYMAYHERMEAEKAARKKKRDISEGLYWLSMKRHRR